MKTETSPTIGALAKALAAAQGEITGALKDSANPFFKSKYADLASCWDACRKPLAAHGLAVIQTTDADGDIPVVVTTLAHESGEWVRGFLRLVPVKADPQGIGSTLTYARRYALAAMVGLAQIDDDAEAGQGRKSGPVVTPASEGALTPSQAKHVAEFSRDITAVLDGDYDEHQMGAKLNTLRDQMSEDHLVFEAVWKNLDAKTRAAIKRLLDIHKKAAA